MKRIFTEGHWSPYSGQAAEYVHKIQDNADMIYTNRWILNPRYGFAWMEDNRGWVSVMKPKVFRVAGEKRYGYQVYGLSKDGTLRDKSSNWWDTPEEAQENIKRIFKIDMAQESTRGNQMKKKLVKEGWNKGELLKNAIDAAKEAKVLLTQASQDIRRAWGEEHDIFVWLDSEKNNVDDLIFDMQNTLDVLPYDEYKAMVAETVRKEWFNEWGWLNKRIPKACIEDCSGPGQKDEAVAYWVEKLKFNIPRDLMEKAKDYLKEFGAWDDMEIDFWAEADAIDHELSKHILWCFCCDVADGNLRQEDLYLGH